MIVEIKDLPNQKLKTLHIDIEFCESGEVQVKTVPKASIETKSQPSANIPDEMLNSSF